MKASLAHRDDAQTDRQTDRQTDSASVSLDSFDSSGVTLAHSNTMKEYIACLSNIQSATQSTKLDLFSVRTALQTKPEVALSSGFVFYSPSRFWQMSYFFMNPTAWWGVTRCRNLLNLLNHTGHVMHQQFNL